MWKKQKTNTYIERVAQTVPNTWLGICYCETVTTWALPTRFTTGRSQITRLTSPRDAYTYCHQDSPSQPSLQPPVVHLRRDPNCKLVVSSFPQTHYYIWVERLISYSDSTNKIGCTIGFYLHFLYSLKKNPHVHRISEKRGFIIEYPMVD